MKLSTPTLSLLLSLSLFAFLPTSLLASEPEIIQLQNLLKDEDQSNSDTNSRFSFLKKFKPSGKTMLKITGGIFAGLIVGGGGGFGIGSQTCPIPAKTGSSYSENCTSQINNNFEGEPCDGLFSWYYFQENGTVHGHSVYGPVRAEYKVCQTKKSGCTKYCKMYKNKFHGHESYDEQVALPNEKVYTLKQKIKNAVVSFFKGNKTIAKITSYLTNQNRTFEEFLVQENKKMNEAIYGIAYEGETPYDCQEDRNVYKECVDVAKKHLKFCENLVIFANNTDINEKRSEDFEPDFEDSKQARGFQMPKKKKLRKYKRKNIR